MWDNIFLFLWWKKGILTVIKSVFAMWFELWANSISTKLFFSVSFSHFIYSLCFLVKYTCTIWSFMLWNWHRKQNKHKINSLKIMFRNLHNDFLWALFNIRNMNLCFVEILWYILSIFLLKMYLKDLAAYEKFRWKVQDIESTFYNIFILN